MLNTKEKIKKLYRLRKLLVNFSFRSAANLFSKFLGLITLPIITRALGPEAYGNYNLVMIIIQYTSLPMGLMGLRSYGIREIAAKRKSKSYSIEILSLHFTIAVISIIVSLIISYVILKSNTLFFLAINFGYIIVFARAFDLEFFYVSQKDLVFPTVAKIVGQLFYVAGVILFIRNPNDFVILVLLASLSPSIGDIIQLRKFNLDYSKIKIQFSIKNVITTFKKTWQLGVSQNLEGLLATIPQLLLPIMIGTYALGIYAGGYKVYSILILFYVTFFYALAPYMVQLNNLEATRRKKYHLLIFSVTFSFSCFVGVFLYLFGEPIVLLILGKSFGESITVFKAISLTLIPLTPVLMLLGNILIYSSYEKYYLIGLIFNGITIVISSPILIKFYGTVGAVYSLASSMMVSIIVLVYFYFKIEKQFNLKSK